MNQPHGSDHTYQYDVFLSYRHTPLDNIVTRKTFTLLESYKLPKVLADRGASHICRCFRDTEELAVSRILSDTIETALRATNCLVVVCSLNTPSSEWVDREVATFIELGRAEKIYPLLIAGDPERSFPPSLKKIPDIMSRVMDVRSADDTAKAIIKNEELALLKVIAAVTGCRESDLLRQHKLRKAHRALVSRLAGVTLAAGVTLISAALWFAAEGYRQSAQREQQAAMTMLQSLTYELPARLVEWQFTGSRISDILEDNTAQIMQILDLARDKQGIESEIAANYAKLGTIQGILGNYERAVTAGEEALAIYRTLYERGDQAVLPELAAAYNNLALSRGALGEDEAAADALREAIALQTQWIAQNDGQDARHQMAVFLLNSGEQFLRRGAHAEAAQQLTQALNLLERLDGEGYLLAGSLKLERPVSPAIDLARTAQNLGVCYLQTSDYAAAEQWLKQAAAYAETALGERQNLSNLTVLQRCYSNLASALTQQGKFEEAAPIYEQIVAIQQNLAADSENIEAQEELALLYNNYGAQLNLRDQFTQAAVWYQHSADLRRALMQQLGTPQAQADYARALYNLGENAFKMQDYTTAQAQLEECLLYYAPIAESLGAYHHSEYLARLCYYQMTCQRDYYSALLSAGAAVDLQPDSTFARLNFAYALLFAGHSAAAGQVFAELAALSPGIEVYVRGDFAAFAQAGLPSGQMSAMLDIFPTSDGSQ